MFDQTIKSSFTKRQETSSMLTNIKDLVAKKHSDKNKSSAQPSIAKSYNRAERLGTERLDISTFNSELHNENVPEEEQPDQGSLQ